ncbi:TolC family protein [Chitinophaga nivalis]|uniref:TolC family protein n=1 Tax=Chitinophaga nivalis TaxID=2991709 RepID=A0ABT3IN82_9BACT|nr:TolC family protein [Chitinophaga nivalis]MCW3464894.1 TolC family protein [Chitinophaga nivalis]MCW3485415.1 TolC family protein [Chitinophaga nivalis]
MKTIRSTARLTVAGILIYVLLGSGKLLAQTMPLSLPAAVKMGLTNSKELKLSRGQLEAAMARYNQARDAALPTAKASYGFTHAEIPAHRLNMGEQAMLLPDRADSYMGTLSLYTTLFNGNQLRFARKSAALLADIARLDIAGNENEIVYAIISTYYELYKVIQLRQIADKNEAALVLQLQQANRFFEQGLVTKNDVLRFELQLSDIRIQAVTLENNRQIIQYNLAVLLGIAPETACSPAPPDTTTPAADSLDHYLQLAWQHHSGLQQSTLQQEAAQLQLKSIRAAQLPALKAGADLYYVNAVSNFIPASGQYITPITVGVKVTWDMGTLWTTRNKAAGAAVQLRQTHTQQLLQQDYISREVHAAFRNYHLMQEKVQLLQPTIRQAIENDNMMEVKYQHNIIAAIDRIDAQVQRFRAQINYELAVTEAALAYYTLLKSTGTLTHNF